MIYCVLFFGLFGKLRVTMIMNKNINILALESAGSNCSVALYNNGMLFSDYNIYEKNLHDKYLAEFTRRIISDAGLTINDINAVAVSEGPGSFTGLRISASIAKGITFSDDIKLISVPTLSALASFVSSNIKKLNHQQIIATVKAHKDLFYYQIFDSNGQINSEITFSTIEEFNNLDYNSAFICGSAANDFPRIDSVEEFNILSAKYIGAYAVNSYSKNEFTKSEDYIPVYIQEFQLKNQTK
jgi:tRNA threonylcarbamoyladenosine biosynthesis protein TsaB